MNQISVRFVSKWAEGDVDTSAMLNLDTGEVSDIETSDDGGHYEHLRAEVVEFGDLVSEPLDTNAQGDHFITSTVCLNKFRALAGLDPLWEYESTASFYQCTFIDTPESILLVGDPTKVAMFADHYRSALKEGVSEVRGELDDRMLSKVLRVIYLDEQGKPMPDDEVSNILENFDGCFISASRNGIAIGHESENGDEIFIDVHHTDLPAAPLGAGLKQHYVAVTPFYDGEGRRGMLTLDVMELTSADAAVVGFKAAKAIPGVREVFIGEAALASEVNSPSRPGM